VVEVFNIGLRFGKYELIRKLAEGGMGTIFIARDASLDRELVIKFLLPEHANNPQVVQRFLQEGRSLAKIVHPGIVTVYETGEVQGTRTHADGCAYIVMELLHGETLAQRLKRVGRLTVTVAMEVCRQVANALQAAHELGIIHRDLKPDNIMLVRDAALSLGERAKVLDFGIAKIAKSAAGSDNSTQVGLVFGTPIYMSPEQAKSTASAGTASDVYSLGCILFELLVGRPPFDGSMAELIAHHILTPPPVPSAQAPGIPPHLDQVIGAMMAKNPDERPGSMKVVEAILEEKRVVASMSRRRTLGGAKLITQPPPMAGAMQSPIAALAASGQPLVSNVRTPPMGVPQQPQQVQTAPGHVPPSNHATMAAPMPVPGGMPLMPSAASMAASNAKTAAPSPALLAGLNAGQKTQAVAAPNAPAQWPASSAPQPIATPMTATQPAQHEMVTPSYPTTLSALSGTATTPPAKKSGKGMFIGLALVAVVGGVIAIVAVTGGGGDETQPAASPGSDTVAKPDEKPIDTKPVDTKPVDTKPVDTKPVDTKPPEDIQVVTPTDTKPADIMPADTKTITITSSPPTDTKPTDTKPTDSKTVTITSTPTDTKPADTKTTTKPADTKTVTITSTPTDTKPADTKTTTKPADTKTVTITSTPTDTKTTTKPGDTKPGDTKTTTKPGDTKTTTKPGDTKTTKPKCTGAHCEFDGKF
jgi:serine/threonine protein kinase